MVAKVGLIGLLLIGIAAILLIVDEFSAYPYVHSRLAGHSSVARCVLSRPAT
jgi:hypothetical protein